MHVEKPTPRPENPGRGGTLTHETAADETTKTEDTVDGAAREVSAVTE